MTLKNVIPFKENYAPAENSIGKDTVIITRTENDEVSTLVSNTLVRSLEEQNFFRRYMKDTGISDEVTEEPRDTEYQSDYTRTMD